MRYETNKIITVKNLTYDEVRTSIPTKNNERTTAAEFYNDGYATAEREKRDH